MFPAYSGFEELPLRVEVEWQRQKRIVVARVKQWPRSGGAIVVCALEDDTSFAERVIVMGRHFYHIGSPDNLLYRLLAYDVSTREPQNKRAWSERGAARLSAIVRRAFASNDANFSLARLLLLPDLPGEPRTVLESGEGLFWCFYREGTNYVPFKIALLPAALAEDEHAAREQLQRAWNNRFSDAHFAWRWANLSDAERLKLLTGFEGDWSEFERVIRLILTTAGALWSLDNSWSWSVGASGEDGYLRSYGAHHNEKGAQILQKWIEFLRAHFIPRPRRQLPANHVCARQFWDAKYYTLGTVDIEGAPTAHEQLEAKLQLRDWLQDKATPEQSAALLASLDVQP